MSHHLAWGTHQPCPGTLELTKTLLHALHVSVDYELQAEIDSRRFGGICTTMADRSSRENSSQAESTSARVIRSCENGGAACRDPVSHCPYKLNSHKRHTCLERELDGVQSPGRPADDRQGDHVLPRVHPALSALGTRHALRGQLRPSRGWGELGLNTHSWTFSAATKGGFWKNIHNHLAFARWPHHTPFLGHYGRFSESRRLAHEA